VRLVGVVDEDPFNALTWSGSSRYFFQALQQQGVLHSAIGAETSTLVRRWYQATSFQSTKRCWRFRFHLNTSYYRALTRAVRSQLDAIDPSEFDVALQIGAWYDLPSITSKPVVSYHDGNLASLLHSPYGYPPIAARHIRRTLNYERDLYARLSLIFPMSRWLADSFMTDAGVASRKLVPVGAGINLPYVRNVQKDYQEPRILFVGKDFNRKGGPGLLEAFSIVRRELPKAELVVIGPNLTALPPGVRSLGVISKTRVTDVERLLDEYEAASLFVMPSLYEPFGVVFGEAMAHRCPCIGTNICAVPEIITHGETGFVTPPGDARALASRMISVLKEPAMAKAFGDAGYLKYTANLNWRAVAGKICAAISSELGVR